MFFYRGNKEASTNTTLAGMGNQVRNGKPSQCFIYIILAAKLYLFKEKI